MPRPLNFRAKLDNGQWFYWTLANDISVMRNNIDWDTVGQDLGIRDKNGISVYEDDIIKFNFHDLDAVDVPLEHGIGVVQYSSLNSGYRLLIDPSIEDNKFVGGGEMYEMPWEDSEIWTFSILGNIHSNLDLLK